MKRNSGRFYVKTLRTPTALPLDLKRNEGFSLVAVMVTLMIVSVMAVIYSAKMKDATAIDTAQTAKEDLIDIRRYITQATDCAQTMSPRPGGCDDASAPFIELKDQNGKTVVKNIQDGNPTIFSGRFIIRAKCVACGSKCASGKGVFLEYARKLKSKEYKSSDSYHWVDLMGGIPTACNLP